MDSLPFSPRPDLAQYRKRAKELVAVANAPDETALRTWLADWLQNLARLLGVAITRPLRHALDRAIAALEAQVRSVAASARARGSRFALSDAQFVIAAAHGFENWAEFARHFDDSYRASPEGGEFESAVDAVVDGDLTALSTLVRANPRLVKARSARAHHATLLHYVAANGVEDFRQRTPPNAVAVARFLLESGAEVDALADTYGKDYWQTTMNLLVSSAHPAGAGLMPALVDVLLDFGAAVNGLKDDETPLLTALDFGYADAAEALVRRGARVDNVVTAAAMGDLDLVRRFVVGPDAIAQGVPRLAPPWARVSDDDRSHIEFALAWSCKFARAAVAEFLLDLGVDPASWDGYKMTALHWAAANGMTRVVERLIQLDAPLEVENTWGGTVLDSTAYFAEHQPVKGVDYLAMLDLLIARGAGLHALGTPPTGSAYVDEILRRHGVT